MPLLQNRRELGIAAGGFALLALTGYLSSRLNNRSILDGPIPHPNPNDWNHPDGRIAANTQFRHIVDNIGTNIPNIQIPSHLEESREALAQTFTHVRRYIFEPNAQDKLTESRLTRGAIVLNSRLQQRDAIALGQMVFEDSSLNSISAATRLETGDILLVSFYDRQNTNLDIRVDQYPKAPRWPTLDEISSLNAVFTGGYVDRALSRKLLEDPKQYNIALRPLFNSA